MTDQQKKDLLWLVGFVAIMGTLVIAVVSALLARWRRSLLSDGRGRPSADMPDLWKAGGQRLTRQMDAGGDDDDDEINPFEGPGSDEPDLGSDHHDQDDEPPKNPRRPGPAGSP